MQTSQSPTPAGSVFETAISGYSLTFRFSQPRYYFRLARQTPGNGTRWIWPSLANDQVPAEAIALLLEAFRDGKPVKLSISSPIGNHQGEPLARLVELSRF